MTLTAEQEQALLWNAPQAIYERNPLCPQAQFKAGEIWGEPRAATAWPSAEQELNLLEFPDWRGGVNPGDQRALFHLAAATRSGKVLEVGTHIGRSTTAIALALREFHDQPRLDTVDIMDVNAPESRYWEQYGSPMAPARAVFSLACAHFTEFHTADSIQWLQHAERQYDLIFLDGLHRALQVYYEVPLAMRRLVDGGLIVVHDYFPNGEPLWYNYDAKHGVRLALERTCVDLRSLVIQPLGELPWPTKCWGNKTSLAVLLNTGGGQA